MKNREDSDEDLYKSLIVGNLGINQGMILENMVAQMLRASGHGLYFHEYLYRPEGTSRDKKYEIDFMTVKKKKICPIEVKSSGYTSHKSFDYLIQKYQLKMEDRYIIYTKDVKFLLLRNKKKVVFREMLEKRTKLQKNILEKRTKRIFYK